MKMAVAEGWVEAPLRRFVEDSRVLFALLLHPTGQVLGQHGFTRAVDVMAACALASAIHASAGALGRELDGTPFTELHHAGRAREIYIAEARSPAGPLILVTVFDGATSVGLVQLYCREFRRALAASAPQPTGTLAPGNDALGVDFERELNRNLAVLFGRAQSRPDGERRSPPIPE
ncbi:MAG TPA: hypothetical protein VJ596_05450 [Gemmatimonadaceae bacterium]|nr:hypothetical protein [Gemmatimonadaceae bacterium]